MADEEPADGEFEEEELDDEEIDVEEIDDEAVVAGLDEDVVLADDDDGDDEAPAASTPKKDDDEDDDDDVDPDDVEADLDRILKDRIAANEDEDDEEEEAPAPRAKVDTPDGVQPKKAHEFMCTGCFLLVNPGQFGTVGSMECPVGEEACPAIDKLTKQLTKARK